ncbi:MAG: PAS domain S-box protein, partial [Proteobacteria bacterium]|nr:PAS domain S-box protein [Pseudomonadota bacterium]
MTGLLALLGLAILSRSLSIETQIDGISQARNLSAAARRLEVNTLGYSLAVREYAQNRDPRARQDAARGAAGIERQLQDYRRYAGTDRQRALAARLEPSWARLRALGQELLDAEGAGEAVRPAISTEFYARRVALEQLLDEEVQAEALEAYNQRRQVALSDLRTIATFSLVLLGIGVLLAGATGVVVSRGILRGERELWASRERLRVTLASIGDAVITTDTRGRVSYLNAVAEALTGWDSDEATGRPLEEVFRIIGEDERQPVESPATRALREGVIVGLANHTLLITRDGLERPIDDSAAPIHGEHGEVLGVVLIFRDVTERREAEKNLKQAHDRRNAMFEAALDCIISTDHEDTIIEFNAAAERTFGYRREQVLGRPLGEVIIPPAYRERHRKGVEHYLATGEGPIIDQRLELSALRADGSEFPVELTVTRIPLQGTPVFTAYLRDITERKHAQAALAESEARWRGIFERLHEGFVLGEIVHDRAGTPVDWRYLEMNGSWERITGLSREFAQGRTLTEVVPGVEPEWVAEFANVAATGQPANFLRHVAALDRWYEVHAFRPEPGRFAALFLEVTDRQEAQIRLRESETRLRFVLDSMPQKIFTAKPDGTIDYFNPQWSEFTGLSQEHILGWGWTRFVHPDDADETIRHWRHAVDSEEPVLQEHRF